MWYDSIIVIPQKISMRIFRHPKFLFLIGVASILIVGGAGIFSLLEGWSYLDSLYFTVSTITTVGYGDLHVTQTLSKLIAIFYMVLIVPFVLGSIELTVEIIHDKMLKE